MKRDSIPGFPARLRALREAAGLSIDDLAARAGIHRDSVSKMEREVRAPTLRVACLLADALGVLVDELRPPVAQPTERRSRGRPKKVQEKIADQA